jgi:two-component system chemotaxis response regulator CheY
MAEVEFERLNVLIIDDEPFMRQLIIRVLGEIGVSRIDTAEDGAEGMGKVSITRHPYDLIFCDLEMPKMNGLQFVKRLRELERPDLANIPVLIVTGHSDEKNVHTAIELGIQGFLIKPISKMAVQKRINMALAGVAQGDEGDDADVDTDEAG